MVGKIDYVVHVVSDEGEKHYVVLTNGYWVETTHHEDMDKLLKREWGEACAEQLFTLPIEERIGI